VKWKVVELSVFTDIDTWFLDILSHMFFFLGPPVCCLHIYGGAVDARCSQKEKLGRTSLLVVTAWFWEEATLLFSSLTHAHSFSDYL